VSGGCGGGRTTVFDTGFFFAGLEAAVAADFPASSSAAIANTNIASVRLDIASFPSDRAPSCEPRILSEVKRLPPENLTFDDKK
jgi:hypothetical protein